MRNDLSELVLVVDRSGSMGTCRTDAEGGINSFIKEQRGQPGEANLTLVQFDDKYEFVHKGTPIMEVGDYKLKPRGWTALLDAVGKAINETGERLAAMPESDRPGCVLVVIVTDGHENGSKEFTWQQVHDMVVHQQEVYNWKFTFIGADVGAFDVGQSLGLNAASILHNNPKKYQASYDAIGQTVSDARLRSAQGQSVNLCYNASQRQAVL
jgi:Mg-chelatase subunit ChlD